MARLASYRIGTGARSTVLLHGFLGSGKNLRSLAQRWSERDPERAFLILDLTGHGASPPLPPDAGLVTLAGDVQETMAAEGMAAAALVGHSLGGRVALALAEAAPEAVTEVVLLDITPGPIDDRLSASRRALEVLLRAPDQAPDRRTLRAFLVDGGLSPGTADWLVMNVRLEDGQARWTFDRRALDRLQARISADDLWPVVERRTVPVRCIRGERSGYVTDADVARLQAAGCPVDTLAGAGHELHVEALEALVDCLSRSPGPATPSRAES
jgi:pimeloyl-ACP methyl ester carboxylesterase